MMDILIDPLIMVVTAMAVFYACVWTIDRITEVHDNEG